MALLSRTKPQQPEDEAVPRLYDDPRIGPAQSLLTTFNERYEYVKRRRLQLDYEAHFGNRPDGDDRNETDKLLRDRLRVLQAELPPQADAPPAGRGEQPGAISAGLRLLAGETITPPPDRAERRQELDRELEILDAAIREQQEIRDGIAAELTVEYAELVKPRWNALQLEMYRAAQELARSARRVRELRAAIVAAGIGSASTILSMPNVRAPLILGDESDWSSEIAGWRRTLQGIGIIP